MSALNNSLLLGADAGGAAGYEISRSLRFSSIDSAYLSRTPASAGNRKTWTWAGWVKRSVLGQAQQLFGVETGGDQHRFGFSGGDTIEYLYYAGAFPLPANKVTTQVFRDPSAWLHLVVVWDTTNGTASDRMRIYVNGVRITAFSASTDPSSSFDGFINSTSYVHRIAGTTGVYFSGLLADIHFCDGTAYDASAFGEFDATTGVWVPKAFTGSYGTNGFHLDFADNSSNTATTLGKDTSGNGNNWTPNNLSVALDQNYIAAISATGAAIDTAYGPVTNGFDNNSSTFFRTTGGSSGTPATITFAPQQPITITSSLVFRGYIGGNQGYSVQIGSTTLASGASDPSGNTDWTVPGASGLTISRTTPLKLSANNSGGGGEGVWWNYLSVNGSQLVFSASSIGANDSLVDVPTNGSEVDTGSGGEVRGNYCTLNPLVTGQSSLSLSNGNLDWSMTQGTALATIGISGGKYYWEVTANSSNLAVGIALASVDKSIYIGYDGKAWGYYSSDGSKYNNYPVNGTVSYGASWTTGDIIGIAFDADNGTLAFYKNGVSQGQAFSGLTSGPYFPAVGNASSAGFCNFGQRPFAYQSPGTNRPVSTYKALCTANLPAPVVTKPSTVMDVALYTGNGTARSITGLGFSPDMVWIKSRSAVGNHRITDIVRGVTKELSPDLTNAEGTDANGVTAFNSDGFSLGISSFQNGSGTTYAAWTWDAGSATVTNTQGSITSQVRANASAGFSVVSYNHASGVGASTIGHGLGVAPSLILSKYRDGGTNWDVYVRALGPGGRLILNSTAAFSSETDPWNNTNPTSTVFSVGPSSWKGVGNHVAYCFAPVVGYSSFGSYTANGANDGPFIYLGFRPRWIMIKAATDTTYSAYNGWLMIDAQRYPYNGFGGASLYANASYQEGTGGTGTTNPLVWLDILSNGFKIRRGETELNFNGTYIYAAFAENPFQYARAR